MTESGRAFLSALFFAAVMTASTSQAPALPIKPTPGQNWCQCACGAGDQVRDLSWQKNITCNSNGKACTLVDGGKSTPGTLHSCSECQAEDGGWRCYPFAAIRSSPVPQGTLKRAP